MTIAGQELFLIKLGEYLKGAFLIKIGYIFAQKGHYSDSNTSTAKNLFFHANNFIEHSIRFLPHFPDFYHFEL